MDEITAMELLQNELAHWKDVAQELEQRVEDLLQNESRLIRVAQVWEEIAREYKKAADAWKYLVIQAYRIINEMVEK